MMIFIVPVLFVGWKFFKGTKFHRAKDIDLLKNLAEIEEYQRTFVPTKSGYVHLHLHLRSKIIHSTFIYTRWRDCC